MTNETNDQQTLEEKLREQEKDLVLKCGECHEKAICPEGHGRCVDD